MPSRLLRLAVVSDLHVGPRSRSTDLRPLKQRGDALEDDFVERFKAFVRAEKIHADYLVVPGDVTHTASPAEFARASEALDEIATTVGVQSRDVILVPGNHDVNRPSFRAFKPDVDEFMSYAKYTPLKYERWKFKEWISRGRTDLCQSPYFIVQSSRRLFSIAYNSAWADTPTTVPHHGLITDETLKAIDEHIRLRPPRSTQIRVFVLHHHPRNYSDPISHEPDFSEMTNAEALLALLAREQFDLVIHGHKHVPRFNLQSTNLGWQLPILASGSFSAILDPRWNGVLVNQFHLVEFHGGRDATGLSRGIVRSWGYNIPQGWVPSRDDIGLPHEVGFGTYTERAALVAVLEPLVTAHLSGTSHVGLRSLLSDVPDLRFVPRQRLDEVITDLVARTGTQRFQSGLDAVLVK